MSWKAVLTARAGVVFAALLAVRGLAQAEPAPATPASRPSAVVVVAGGQPWSDEALGRVRAALAGRFRLLDDPELRAALEGTAPAPLAEQRVRESLGQARQAFRRFQMEAARAALAEAREACAALAPTPAARDVAVEVAVREAEIALADGDVAAGALSFGFALSVDPALMLDPDQYAPPMLRQLAYVRDRLPLAVRVSVKVDSTPPGARLFAAGAEHCCTPLRLELPAGPQLLWIERAGFAPQARRLHLASGGPISFALEPLPLAQRTRTLVEGLRGAGGAARSEAASALAEALGVEAVALLGAPEREPDIYPRRPAPAALAAARLVSSSPPAGPPARRRWPALSAAGAAALLIVSGAILGWTARLDERRAADAGFASEGKQLWLQGERKARWANGLFIGAGAAAAVSVPLFLVF